MNEWVADKRPYGIGQDLFREGQPPRDAFLIERGKVEISRMVNGAKVVLGYRGVGEVLGEMALLDKKPRSATATAVEPTVVVVISQELFDQHLGKATPLLRKLLETFTRNLRDMGERLH